VAVGEDIRCPALIVSNGTIRIRSARAAQVATWFGLARRPKQTDAKSASDPAAVPSIPAIPVTLQPGTITLITGPSGAGKSTLLRAVRERHADRRWIDLAHLDAPDVPLVDCFGDDLPLRDALALLARVGLGEAWTYLRTPAELSEGQRWRFRLALAIHAARKPADRAARSAKPPATSTRAEGGGADAPIIACDEFAAVLDRVTAIAVAHRLRREIDATPNACAVVATSHEDLEPALAAETVVRCDFGKCETFQKMSS
jgi:ABC-type ATPase with predicted acetyltransferase domain